ncbi:hypothetical protein [Marinimicrobium agarilyticum]|uniref:hypothetical protein n=1 Tax=Marinimicrobium agarilyticum TaxID=306546 RepID=UPI00040A96D5|nr:hypothetical protein [Marinimicrobium agarilyticum]
MSQQSESRMNRTPCHPKGKGKTLEQQYADRAMQAAYNFTETEAQVLWALCGQMLEATRGAQHLAFMILSEKQNPHVSYRTEESAADFQGGFIRELGEVKKQIQAIGKLMNEGIEGLKAEEGKAA